MSESLENLKRQASELSEWDRERLLFFLVESHPRDPAEVSVDGGREDAVRLLARRQFGEGADRLAAELITDLRERYG